MVFQPYLKKKKKKAVIIDMLKNNKLILSHRALQFVIQISRQNRVIKTCLPTSLPVKTK